MRNGLPVLLIVIAVCVQSCTVSDNTKVGSFVDSSTTSVGHLSTASTEGTSSDETTLIVDSSIVPRLESVIPPCIPVDGSDQDPCAGGKPPYVAALSVSAYMSNYEIAELTDILQNDDSPVLSRHIVIRSTILPSSTRCEIYTVEQFRFAVQSDLIGEDLHHYLCFVEVRVNEYIVGQGPAQLTVAIHREIMLLDRGTWPTVKDSWLRYLKNPHSRTASAYEGREAIMFLRLPATIAVETWSVNGSFNLWFLQRTSTEGAGQAEGGWFRGSSGSGGNKSGYAYGGFRKDR